ncbi:hypothetical protein [Treponema sp.]|uniref:hypothetical protein n=1 Tax=Treponema sp. TaxID=166 RepID=UPI003890083B
MKTLQEKWEDDGLSDNSSVIKCKQCKGCAFQNDGTVWSNSFEKACCAMYPYPGSKPIAVMRNEDECPYKE